MIIDAVIVIIIINIIVTTNMFTAVVSASYDIIVSCVYIDHDNIESVPQPSVKGGQQQEGIHERIPECCGMAQRAGLVSCHEA